jgi:hypothetical protein
LTLGRVVFAGDAHRSLKGGITHGALKLTASVLSGVVVIYAVKAEPLTVARSPRATSVTEGEVLVSTSKVCAEVSGARVTIITVRCFEARYACVGLRVTVPALTLFIENTLNDLSAGGRSAVVVGA